MMGRPENKTQKIGRNQRKQAGSKKQSQGETPDWLGHQFVGTTDPRPQMPPSLRIIYHCHCIFTSFLEDSEWLSLGLEMLTFQLPGSDKPLYLLSVKEA